MADSAPGCRSSRCRHRGECARNPALPAAGGDGAAERPRCFEPSGAAAPSDAPFGRMAD